jgi:hypothetical protein
MVRQNRVAAITSGGSASPIGDSPWRKTMEILAEGAVVANALRTTRSTFYRLSIFAFHHFAALGDQKITRFLAE